MIRKKFVLEARLKTIDARREHPSLFHEKLALAFLARPFTRTRHTFISSLSTSLISPFQRALIYSRNYRVHSSPRLAGGIETCEEKNSGEEFWFHPGQRSPRHDRIEMHSPCIYREGLFEGPINAFELSWTHRHGALLSASDGEISEQTIRDVASGVRFL